MRYSLRERYIRYAYAICFAFGKTRRTPVGVLRVRCPYISVPKNSSKEIRDFDRVASSSSFKRVAIECIISA